MIRFMSAALSVGAEGAFSYVGRNSDFFLVEDPSGKKEPIFPSWLDAMNCVILDALPPPYRHGKEVCQGCYYRFCSPSWRG